MVYADILNGKYTKFDLSTEIINVVKGDFDCIYAIENLKDFALIEKFNFKMMMETIRHGERITKPPFRTNLEVLKDIGIIKITYEEYSEIEVLDTGYYIMISSYDYLILKSMVRFNEKVAGPIEACYMKKIKKETSKKRSIKKATKTA